MGSLVDKSRILVVEDDKNISRLIVYNLEKAGYEARVVFSGEEALKLLECFPFDLVVLDLMLPEVDGLEVCRRIRGSEKTKDTPILMLTAKGEEVDRVVGLELGADDYMVKPFSPRELILRIKAILRRGDSRYAPEEKTEVLTVDQLKVDFERHKVFLGKTELKLTLMEFKLLVTFLQRRGRLQTRDRLLADVWDMAADVDTRTVDTHIKRLRRKLGKWANKIQTVRGLGYRLKEKDES